MTVWVRVTGGSVTWTVVGATEPDTVTVLPLPAAAEEGGAEARVELETTAAAGEASRAAAIISIANCMLTSMLLGKRG